MVLLTGATGFIGSHLVEALCDSGEPVRCLLRRDYLNRRSFRLPPTVEPAFGDLTSGEGLAEAVGGADVVIHLAGVTKALSQSEYYRGNVTASQNLARALAGRSVRMVHVSSLAAIGPGSENAPVDERTEPHPVTHYGKSKLEGERAVRELLPDAVIVRPPVVYGPRDTDVFEILKSLSKGLMLQIAGGERWFQAIYVKDLAKSLIAAAKAPAARARDYFVGNAAPVSWSEFASCAARVMRKKPRTLTIPAPLAWIVGAGAETWAHVAGKPGIISREKIREAQCAFWTCDVRSASKDLGFEAQTPLECGLTETLAWYREAGWLNY